MSRFRVTDTIDGLLGTTTFRGEVVRRGRSGVFTNGDALKLDTGVESLAPIICEEACSTYRHGKLRGRQRCRGCGRTRNEIEIDGG
jgi:hypothetical protein